MIKRFEKGDLEAVMQLWLEGNLSAHSFINPDFWYGYYPKVKTMIPEAEVWVYQNEAGKISGFISLSENEISGIFVDRTCLSQGIGKALADHVKGHRKELILKVYRQNVRARLFYEREGFNIIEEKYDEESGEAEWVMGWKRQIIALK